MNILEILFLLSITFSMIKADEENICLTSNCSSLFITFPFKLHNSQTQDNCSYIDLKCNYMNETATINLPNAGDYYVRTIDYEYPSIELYDRDCVMMRRFMSNNFSLSSSPFESILDFINYTFYSCPPSYPNTDELIPIDCLSTPTNVTVAAYSPAENVTDVCHEIGSRLLPILLGGDYHDLYLTWDPTTLTSCPACDNTLHPDPRYGDRGNSPEAPEKQDNTPDYSPYIVAASLLTAAVIVVCLTFVTRIMTKENEADGLQLSAIATAEAEAAAAPPGGVEESRISDYTELLVHSESIIISYGSDSRTCPICLESFEPRDLSRSIAKCGHCFHDECVVPWLIQTGTCPICRINISDP